MSKETDAMKDSNSYFGLAKMRFQEVVNKPADGQQYALAMGLLSLSTATSLLSDAIFARIERLHQKIDRIEKKLGSV